MYENKCYDKKTYPKLLLNRLINALPTPLGTQMWIQIENNERVKNWGTFLSSQHFGGVEGRVGALGWD
jgi:hypothetical protein